MRFVPNKHGIVGNKRRKKLAIPRLVVKYAKIGMR